MPFLLDALLRLRAQGRPLRLLMVGSGPDADVLAARVVEMGLGDAVAFEPPQAIRAVLARGRVMVVPSLAESLPYVVLEAAAACQPLVATNVGGIPEIFGPAAAQLVPARDGKALAGAIARILDEEPEARAALRRARRLRQGAVLDDPDGLRRALGLRRGPARARAAAASGRRPHGPVEPP